MLRLGCVLAAMLLVAVHTHAAETVALFDGKTFAGWNGDTEHT